jgi:hypothetical protein
MAKEHEICERTLRRLQEHADVMGISVEEALKDVIPATRMRLVAHMQRCETHYPEGGTNGIGLPGWAR